MHYNHVYCTVWICGNVFFPFFYWPERWPPDLSRIKAITLRMPLFFFLLHCEQTCHPITAAVMVCLLRRHHRQNTASEVTLCLDGRQKKRRNVKRKIKYGQVAVFCLLKRQNVSERTSCSPSGIPKTCASSQSQLFRDDGDAKRVILSSRLLRVRPDPE